MTGDYDYLQVLVLLFGPPDGANLEMIRVMQFVTTMAIAY